MTGAFSCIRWETSDLDNLKEFNQKKDFALSFRKGYQYIEGEKVRLFNIMNYDNLKM